ncbi:uncharacterized protein LOC113518119 [Galleria mellonella]|uniref:Uncharacterized protein LOC113518119 n=1 Tax=Galleria mellonella TaxID=7137 RepID=A0A6J1WSI1_GALME|nr:uncharacterized protein LOC113518119 [Galleria mellonella]
MSLKKVMKGLPPDLLAAEGLLYHDWTAISSNQRECISRLGITIQMEQESYLIEHPEVKAMLEVFVSKMTRLTKKKDVLKEAAIHFTRPAEVLDQEIRERLGLPTHGPYKMDNKPKHQHKDLDLEYDLRNIILKHYPPEEWKIPTPVIPTPDTASSSFMSLITSDTTLPTPEPIPTPEPTLSETFFAVVSYTVDKAIYLHVDDAALRYDTAYVELMKIVEEAMEIPVIEIREDIANLFYNAYKMFELNIMEKERIAAEIAWEKRTRKKMKRTLRKLNNFKGYETPTTPKSEISSHESYMKPPPRPCVCHPQLRYNRYPKDRFGIYLPRETTYSDANVTSTPAISLESIAEPDDDDKVDTKSIISKKSGISTKSSAIKKNAAFQ